MLLKKSICETEFAELCRYVGSQLSPSGLRELDRKTLAFGIYWQICSLLDIEITIPPRAEWTENTYAMHLDEIMRDRTDGSFDGVSCVEACIESKLKEIYGREVDGLEKAQISSYA